MATKAAVTAVTAAPAKAPFATFSSRLVARLIDWALIAVLSLVIIHVPYFLAVLFFRPPSALLLTLYFLPYPLYIAYFAILTARSGQTVGKRLMGIQVLDTSGRVPSAASSTGRAAADFIFYHLGRMLIGFIDYLWMLRQKESRALHDLAAGTTVRRIAERPSEFRVFALAAAALVVMVGFSVIPPLVLRQTRPQLVDNMYPTIQNGESWLVSNLAYRQHSPPSRRRGGFPDKAIS